MIKTCKNTLSTAGVPVWGDIHGDITKQKDLQALLASFVDEPELLQALLNENTDLKRWVDEQGYLQMVKTINGQTLVGEGNIEISGVSPEQKELINQIPDKADRSELDNYATIEYVDEHAGGGKPSFYIEVNVEPGVQPFERVLTPADEVSAIVDLLVENGQDSANVYIVAGKWMCQATSVNLNVNPAVGFKQFNFAGKGNGNNFWEVAGAFRNDSVLSLYMMIYDHNIHLKTINGESIIGEGNIEISGVSPEQEELINQIPVISNELTNVKQTVEQCVETLSSKADRSEIPSLEGYALKSDIPDVSGFATKEYVDSLIGSLETITNEILG